MHKFDSFPTLRTCVLVFSVRHAMFSVYCLLYSVFCGYCLVRLCLPSAYTSLFSCCTQDGSTNFLFSFCCLYFARNLNSCKLQNPHGPIFCRIFWRGLFMLVGYSSICFSICLNRTRDILWLLLFFPREAKPNAVICRSLYPSLTKSLCTRMHLSANSSHFSAGMIGKPLYFADTLSCT